MKYTVLLKYGYRDATGYDWLQATTEAENEVNAALKAKALVERDIECIVVSTKVFVYTEGDEHDAAILKRARMEDEKENAPANLVRTLRDTNYALNDIGDELREIRVSLPGRNLLTPALSIISATLSLLTATLLLLSLILR